MPYDHPQKLHMPHKFCMMNHCAKCNSKQGDFFINYDVKQAIFNYIVYKDENHVITARFISL